MFEFTQSGTQSLPIWSAVLCGLAALALGGGLGFFVSHYLRKHHQVQTEEEAEQRALRRLAEEERSQHLAFLEEKDFWYRLRAEQEKEIETQIDTHNAKEKDLAGRIRELSSNRDDVRKEAGRLKVLERRLGSREQMLQASEEELAASRAGHRERLEMVANLSAEEAKEQLFEHLSDEVKARSAATIRAERIKTREESDREAPEDNRPGHSALRRRRGRAVLDLHSHSPERRSEEPHHRQGRSQRARLRNCDWRQGCRR